MEQKTTMTPTATYIASENCLQELPKMEKPDSKDYARVVHRPFGEVDCFTDNKYYEDLKQYEEHVATLRRIPCHDSCRGLWVEGRMLEEGKDYEVKECRTWTQREGKWGCAECCNKDAGCDEDCDSSYFRPNCPFCKGKGWFTEQPLFAFPLVPVKSEEDFQHNEVLLNTWKLFVEQSRRGYSYLNKPPLGLNDWHKIYDNATIDFIKELKLKYILTRKQ